MRPVPNISDGGGLSLLPAAVVFGAVSFNAVLAVINAHIAPLTPSAVVASEILIVGAAHLIAMANYKPQMTPWYALLGAFILFAVLRSMVTGDVEVKFLRDVMLIPTFVVLGMTFDHRRLGGLVIIIHALVLAALVFEATATQAYSDFFKIQDYYINTRFYEIENFWNTESELFVSAVRPDARMFSFIDLHRLSSIFLEPVSLGNYTIIIAAYICARFSQLGTAAKWFLIGGNIVAIIGCDGRLAVAASVIIMAVGVIAPRLPARSALVYLPSIVLGAAAIVTAAGMQAGPDNFQGRVAHTVELLGKFDVGEYVGLSNAYLSQAVDSGFAYLLLTQSVFGVALLWLVINFACREDTDDQIRFTHAICIYLALSMMVSFAFLTIKTASLLWFIMGSLNARSTRAREYVPFYQQQMSYAAMPSYPDRRML